MPDEQEIGLKPGGGYIATVVAIMATVGLALLMAALIA